MTRIVISPPTVQSASQKTARNLHQRRPLYSEQTCRARPERFWCSQESAPIRESSYWPPPLSLFRDAASNRRRSDYSPAFLPQSVLQWFPRRRSTPAISESSDRETRRPPASRAYLGRQEIRAPGCG